MNHLISIDGLDGCGKTTIGEKLAEKIDGIYYYTPPVKIHSIRELADNSTPIIRGYYYMLGNLIASRDFETLLKSNHVVSDRYFYATRAFHEPLGVYLPTPKDLLIPDVIIYLTASWETIQGRLAERPIQTPYEDIDYLKRVAEHYESILKDAPGIITVDTTDRTPDDVVDEIIIGMQKLNITL